MGQCIKKFLGPHILNHPVVKGSILTEPEKNKLEEIFQINELDRAIKANNMNSACGIDGLSTRFIAKFWKFFRVPLYNYAICCFRKGTLTNTFNSATIRLIPKKILRIGVPSRFSQICIKSCLGQLIIGY